MIRGCSQEEFIERVRQALAGEDEPVNLPESLEAARVVGPGEDVIGLFLKRAEEAKIQPCWTATEAELVAKILAIVAEHDIRRAVLPAEDIPGRQAVESALRSRGVELLDADDIEACFQADMGISEATAAVAETGSVVLVSGGAHRRMASLAVPVHVAVVRAEAVMPDLLDWAASHPRPMPAGEVLVSAPSKTADIELQLVIGVHGPRHQYVVVAGAGAHQFLTPFSDVEGGTSSGSA